MVRASNGNIDTRKCDPIRLTPAQRERINSLAVQLAQKPVGSLTLAELDVLRQFTGAGGLGFRGKDAETQIAALNQHFTDYAVVDAIWNALERAGVPMKKMLEPSAGSGNFPSRRPDKDWTLVELNKPTAQILKHLFPAAKVMQGTYEDVALSDFDAIISNVPFVNKRVHPDRPDIQALHDYFFVHAVDQVKPNGIVAFISSNGTMDKQNPAIRRELMEKCDLVGAYRLPRAMFRANADTDVVTDVIFLQKRPNGVSARPENKEINNLFVESAPRSVTFDGNTDTVFMNSYYDRFPERVLGTLTPGKDTLHGGKITLVPTMPEGGPDLAAISLDYRPYSQVIPAPAPAPTPTAGGGRGGRGGGRGKSKSTVTTSDVPTHEDGKYPRNVDGLNAMGAKYVLNDGGGNFAQNIRIFDGDVYAAVDEFSLEGYRKGSHLCKVFEPVEGQTAEKIMRLQGIVDQATAFQNGDDGASEKGLSYIDDYMKEFGDPKEDKALKAAFKELDETHYYMELTSPFDKDAEVWHTRVRHSNSGKKVATKDSPLVDRALASEDANGKVLVDAEDSLVTSADVGDLLADKYSVAGFQENGAPILQNNVLFLSGNIYEKLDAMKELREDATHEKYAATIDRQTEMLKGVLPTPRVFDTIQFVGSENWVAKELMDTGWLDVRSYIDSETHTRKFVVGSNDFTHEECDILSRHFSGRKLVDREKNTTDTQYLRSIDEAQKTLADAKAKLRNLLVERSPDVVAKIENNFNRLYNGYVAPDYAKAEYLIADTVKAFTDAGFSLRENQKRWVTQALIEGSGINANDVGGGKTMAAIALAHALKRRGVCKKPMFVVPAKTIKTSWLNSFNGVQKLFPDAKIVNLGSLPADTRAEELFKLSNSNADFVFISHEGFGALELPIKDELKYLDDFFDGLIDHDDNSHTVALERESFEAYRQQVAESKRDTRLTFDKLGVDCIIVDEAHAFKNIGVSSSLASQGLGKSFAVKINKDTGVRTLDSNRSFDFRFKSDFITTHNNGKNVFLLSATPTPNKPIELYSMIRHLSPKIFPKYGIYTDRDFAKMFLATKSVMTYAPSGDKPKQILTEITNMTALKQIMHRYIDRLPMKAFETSGIKLPKANYKTLFLDMSDDMVAIQDDIARRIKAAVSKGSGQFRKKKGEDSIMVAFTNGRSAAVTPTAYGGKHAHVEVADRTHDPHTDKVELGIQLAMHYLKRGEEEGVPMNSIIFSDVHGGEEESGKVTVFEDMKETFIARGLDPKEVVIVTGDIITDPRTGREVKASGAKAMDMKGLIQEGFAPKESKPGERPPKPSIKIVLGSTQTIGEGMNLMTWTKALIPLDIPYTHGAVVQRLGRLVRSGNQHEDVDIYNFIMKGTFDTLSYNIVTTKQGWNSAMWDAKVKDTLDVSEEMSGAMVDPREIIIASIRDPIKRMEKRVELDLERRKKDWDLAVEQKLSLESRIATQRNDITRVEQSIAKNDERIAARIKERNELNANIPNIRKEAANALAEIHKADPARAREVAKAVKKEVENRLAFDNARKASKNARDAQAEAYRKNDTETLKDAKTAIENADKAFDEAKIALGAAETVTTALVNELPKEIVPFVRVFRNKKLGVLATQNSIRDIGDSIKYQENARERNELKIKGAEARIEEINAERKGIEDAERDAREAYLALGRDWYSDFGGEHPRFNLERATLEADKEEQYRLEDELPWINEPQTLDEDMSGGGIDAMPAPSNTGRRRLNKGKLPHPGNVEATGTNRPKQTVSKTDIFRLARELFPELRITNKGTHHKRGVLGWLEVENRVIRTVDPRGVSTLCHELGHAVHRMGEEVKMPRSARGEFIRLGIDLYGSKKPNGGYTGEGIAEFVRGFMCDYDLAKDYPNATKWFFEDFGGRNPEFVNRLYALRGKIMEYVNMAPEHAIRSMWDHSRPMSESELPFIARLRRYDFMEKWVDSNWPIWRAMRNLSVDYNFHDPLKTPAERADLILNHPYMLATFFQNSPMRFAEGDALTNTTDLYGNVTGASLREILKPIVSGGEERLKQFWDFALAMRGADYERKGMEFGRSRNEIAAALGKYRSPEFIKAVEDITDWSHRLLKNLMDAGGITREEYNAIVAANPVYIPLRRVFEEHEIDASRARAGKKALFRRKGGTQDVEHPCVALVEMAAKLRANAQQAKVVQALVKMYDRAYAIHAHNLNQFMIEMPNPVKRTAIWSEKVKDQIARIAKARFGANDGAIIEGLSETWTEELSCFAPTKYNGKGNIVTIVDGNGKLRTFEVVDPAILKLLRGVGEAKVAESVGVVEKWLNTGIRMGATSLSGSFTVKNLLRDTLTSFLMNEYGVSVPYLSSIEGTVNSLLNTDLAKQYFRLGGDMGSFYNGGMHAGAKAIAGQAQAQTEAMRELKKGLLNIVGDFLSNFEVGSRLIPFRNARNYWLSQGVGESAANLIARLCGGDVTIDFNRAGSRAREANRRWLFLNAAIRDLDQIARGIGLAAPLPWQSPAGAKPNPRVIDPKDRNSDFEAQARRKRLARFLGRAFAALTTPALLAYLWTLSNEDRLRRWREMRPEKRWNSIFLDFGGKDGSSPIVRLPVPFLVGQITQSLPIAAIDSILTRDTRPIREVVALMGEQLPFSPSFGGSWYHMVRGFIPSAATPLTDVIANENFGGSSIVPERMRRMDVRDQVSPDTTWTARVMGEVLGVSPLKLEYLLDQYTGGLITGCLRGWENTVGKNRGAIGVDGDLSKIPAFGALFLAPFSSSRLPNDYYTEMEEKTRKYNSGRITPEELGKLKAMESVNRRVLSENAKARRLINDREDIDGATRKRIMDDYSRDTIGVIRHFNDWCKGQDFRDEGIATAVQTLTTPGASDACISRDRNILRDCSDMEVSAALRRVAKSKGWSKETYEKRLRFLHRRR